MLSNYETLITLNGTGISGASLASFSVDNNLSLINSLGQSYTYQLPNGFAVANFSVTKPLCISGGEPLSYLTGNNVFVSGTIQSDATGISFTSGYLNKYSVNYSLSEGPNLSLDFLVFGEIASNRVGSPAYFSGGNHFAKRSLINLGISGAGGVMTDFSYAIEINRVPIFTLGQNFPIEVVSVGPRKFSLKAGGYIDDEINFEANDYNILGTNTQCYLSLMVSGGVSGNVLLDRQSGFFNINQKDISLSADDEMSFNLDAVRFF